jgi:hypothetical protein
MGDAWKIYTFLFLIFLIIQAVQDLNGILYVSSMIHYRTKIVPDVAATVDNKGSSAYEFRQ